MFRANILPIFRSIRLCNTAYGMLYPIRCRSVISWSPSPDHPPATYCVQHTISSILLFLFFPSSSSSSSFSSVGTATLVGFGLLNCRWVFSVERFLQSAAASVTSNPNLKDHWFRMFQLSPQGVPSLKRRKRTPVAEGGTMGEKCPRILSKVATSTSLLGSFTCRKFYDMGPTALLTLRRKPHWGFFRPKNPTASAGFEPANSGTKGSPLNQRSRYHNQYYTV